MDQVMEVAVLILVSRATKVTRVVIIKVIRVVTISNPARKVNSSSNLDFKVIPSS